MPPHTYTAHQTVTSHYWTTHDPLTTALIIGIVLVIYFIPSIVAFHRGHDKRVLILLLNIFAGGTGIVWLVILVWAFMQERTEKIG
jgi:hypothetical protein